MTAELTRFLAAYDAMTGRWPGPVELLDLRSYAGPVPPSARAAAAM
jgi:hypothetical protein